MPAKSAPTANGTEVRRRVESMKVKVVKKLVFLSHAHHAPGGAVHEQRC